MDNSQKIKNSQDCQYSRKRFLIGLSIYLILISLKWTYIVWANENIVEFERFGIWSFIDSLVTFSSLILLVLIIYVFICAYKWFLQVKRANLYVYGTAVMETAYKVGFRRYIFVVSFCDKSGNTKKTRTNKIFTSHGFMDIKKWSGAKAEAAYDSNTDRVIIIKALKN